MNKTVFFYASKMITKRAANFVGLFLLIVAAAMSVSAQKGGGNRGGGTPGDTFTYSIIYTAETCPLPPVVRADYVEIAFCGLGSRSNKPADLVLNVDGYTMLTPGTVKDVNADAQVVLPCGNVATLSRFTETAFAQTSPPPPPYRLFTASNKIANTCR